MGLQGPAAALVRGVKRWARDTLGGAETDQVVMAMPNGDVWRWPALPPPPVLPGHEGCGAAANAGGKRKRGACTLGDAHPAADCAAAGGGGRAGGRAGG